MRHAIRVYMLLCRVEQPTNLYCIIYILQFENSKRQLPDKLYVHFFEAQKSPIARTQLQLLKKDS